MGWVWFCAKMCIFLYGEGNCIKWMCLPFEIIHNKWIITYVRYHEMENIRWIGFSGMHDRSQYGKWAMQFYSYLAKFIRNDHIFSWQCTMIVRYIHCDEIIQRFIQTLADLYLTIMSKQIILKPYVLKSVGYFNNFISASARTKTTFINLVNIWICSVRSCISYPVTPRSNFYQRRNAISLINIIIIIVRALMLAHFIYIVVYIYIMHTLMHNSIRSWCTVAQFMHCTLTNTTRSMVFRSCSPNFRLLLIIHV